MAGSSSTGVISGNQYKEDIGKAISVCKIFILIYSDYVNKSRDVKNELAQAEKKIIIPIRRDYSEMCFGLKYDLKPLEYIDAVGNDFSVVSSRLMVDLRKHLLSYQQTDTSSTDKMLFRQGIKMLNKKQYMDAQKILLQYVEIVPDDAESRFYLALCLIGGKPSVKLDGIIVHKLEALLTPFAEPVQFLPINYLLAMVKFGYYRMNNLRETQPGSFELTDSILLSREKAAEIIFHTYEPLNTIWIMLQKIANN
jgi:hypothetical protein